jgi:hypothetical protein
MRRSTEIVAIAVAGCLWFAGQALAQVFAQTAAPATPTAAAAAGVAPATATPPVQPRVVAPLSVGAPPQAGVLVPRSPGGFATIFAGNAPAADDPEMAKLIESENALAHESDGLIGQYGATENYQEREKLKTKLREVLAKQFDVQRQRRERELKSIEDRLSKLRDQLKKRTDARETIIDRRIESLISDAEGLGWTPPAAGNHPSFNPAGPRPRIIAR